jgi:hypothetical protein
MTMPRRPIALLAGLLLLAASARAQDTEPAPSTRPPPPPSPPAVTVPGPSPSPAPALAPQLLPPTVLPTPQPPVASAPPPGEGEGRYTFHRVQDSFVRLDSRTGQVSMCGHGASGWACQAVADERTALESEISRLQGENAALKREMLSRGLPLPGGVKPEPPLAKAPEKTPDPNASVNVPSDADLDRMMAFIAKAWRKMVEMMADVQRDIQRKN